MQKKSLTENTAVVAAAQIKMAEEMLKSEQKLRDAAVADKKAIKDLQDKMIEEKLASKAGK
jgi:hypothetical protein